MGNKHKATKPKEPRKPLSAHLRKEVLIESGYRCANPTCNFPLIHIHHIVYVQHGGEDTLDNLIALCGNCHPMVHNGTISEEAVRVWKKMIVAANKAWSKDTLNNLLFLDSPIGKQLYLTGDGVVRFSDLLVSGLAYAEHVDFVNIGGDKNDKPIIVELPLNYPYAVAGSELAKVAYVVRLTEKGQRLVEAWKEGSLKKLDAAFINDELE